MTKKRINENWFLGSFKIFFNAIKLYLKNFETFLKILAFPVLGQILGLFLIFLINYFFIMNVPQLAKNNALFNNITFVFTLLIICIIPCFLIFANAFWNYVLSMASISLMANHILDKGTLTDVEIHNDILKPRFCGYVGLVILLSFLYFILTIPLFWVVLIPVIILWSLSIPAFVLEDELSPFGAINRSYLFVRYNFFKTAFLLVLLFLLCYLFMPELFNWLFDKMNLPIFLANPIDLYVNLLPINEFNNLLSQIPFGEFTVKSHEISICVFKAIVSFSVIGFTLPIRCIACCDLYRELRGGNITKDDTEVKKLVKRTSAK